jgi:hypothetical protein
VAEVHRDQRSLLPREGGLTLGPTPTERRARDPRLASRWLLAGPAAVFALAAAAAAVVRSGQPFDHGWWLVAYLALVGSLSQAALCWGQRALAGCLATWRGGRVLVGELVLWNLGTVLVPVGVFAGAPAVVTVGSVALLAALALFAAATSALPDRGPDDHRFRLYAYRAVIIFLIGGVLVGTGLAEALPWQ